MVRTGSQVEALLDNDLQEFRREVAQRHENNDVVFYPSDLVSRGPRLVSAYRQRAEAFRVGRNQGANYVEQILQGWPTEDAKVIPCRDPVTREIKGIVKFHGRALLRIEDIPPHFEVVLPTEEDEEHPVVNSAQNEESNVQLEKKALSLAASHKGFIYKCGRCGYTCTSPRKQNIQRHLDTAGCVGTGLAVPVAIDPVEWAFLEQLRVPLTAAGKELARKKRYLRYYHSKGKAKRQGQQRRQPERAAAVGATGGARRDE